MAFVPTTAGADNATGCNRRTNDSLRKVLDCVTVEGVVEHELALQDIADANGGNRASGTAGHAHRPTTSKRG